MNLEPLKSFSSILQVLFIFVIAGLLFYLLYCFCCCRKKKSSCSSCSELERINLLEAKITDLERNYKKHLQSFAGESPQKEKVAPRAPERKSIVELDEKGVPKASITHLLSIKDMKANSGSKDDLKLIKGIGPFIEEKLNALGIYHFKQIASLNSDDVQKITDAIQFFPGRIDRDEWISQAKLK